MGATQIYEGRYCACSEVRGLLLLSVVVVPIKVKFYFIKIISIYYSSFCSQATDRYIKYDRNVHLLPTTSYELYIYYGVDIFF
jgi:hypothetical protein